MSVCTSTLKATPPERQRASSSPSTTLESKSPPPPPYSTGNSRPRSPSSPRRRQNSRGMRPASSHASTWGATSFSTNARTVRRSISCSSVNIESGIVGGSGHPHVPFHQAARGPVHRHALGPRRPVPPSHRGRDRQHPRGMAEPQGAPPAPPPPPHPRARHPPPPPPAPRRRP